MHARVKNVFPFVKRRWWFDVYDIIVNWKEKKLATYYSHPNVFGGLVVPETHRTGNMGFDNALRCQTAASKSQAGRLLAE